MLLILNSSLIPSVMYYLTVRYKPLVESQNFKIKNFEGCELTYCHGAKQDTVNGA